jgi:hypothetical protein
MSDQDDQFADDAELKEATEAYERDRDGLHDLIADYLDDFEIDAGTGVHMLLDIMVGLRVAAYGFSVENPSASGLKLELDRLSREIADYLRVTKKNAESSIEEIKQARADAEREEGEEEAEDGEEGEDEGEEEGNGEGEKERE